ncbi:MAG: DUF1292 domain-containing protein [Streptococcaceae bacterium]|jgi:uncharacterized protein YrzB (UPF0473 family)|nr:DUF1292 domain-containing protein [Streptococcaceae bacterium]
MGHEHNHEHEHDENEEARIIQLVDDAGNEVDFEVLLTIDGQEEFGKSYVLLLPVGAEDDDAEVEISAYSFTQNADGTEGDLNPIPDDAEDEWAMIEDVFNQFVADSEEE